MPPSRVFVSLSALFIAATLYPATRVAAKHRDDANAPTYNKDGNLIAPRNYREWIFLSSGIDMVYGSNASTSHSRFDNVFVNPEAYRYFQEKGTWPDKTVMVLEVRDADTHPSINKGGHSQGTEVTGLEIHLKDASHNGWSFYAITDGVGKLLPQTASCYTCHQQHGAVDTTFTQFYPTLLPIAKARGTLSPAYLKESSDTK